MSSWASIRCNVPVRHCRLTRPMLALFEEGDGRVARVLPEGTIVTLDTTELQKRELKVVEVICENHRALMFASDLQTLP